MPLDLWDKHWKALVSLDREFEITYIPLDIPEQRDQQLEYLGVRTNYDWGNKVGHIPPNSPKLQDRWPRSDTSDELPNIDWLYELEFIKKYY